ncbi:hypothetical protein BJP25_01285 [Actinokineospora bangkokensis]|uniref:Uncharacterized protein n=1 Tax=Actinokineospora bangkokensis TaxID=1193682 RepID=A0A1Q9LCE5_9PSEU|nr:hypothetical protein BJP25_01285 [Actinokineospora bangkokensis]
MGPAAALLALALAGCGGKSPAEAAAESVRTLAAGIPGTVDKWLASPQAPAGGDELLAYLDARVPSTPDFAFYLREADGPRVRLRIAVTDQEPGTTWDTSQEVARVCVEVTGTRGPRPGSTMTDAPCDDDAIRRAEPDARGGTVHTTTLDG